MKRGGLANPSSSPIADRLLNVDEAAAILGFKSATLYTWASERRIPTVKIGRALRIRLSTVERLIAEGERPALDALRISRRG
jgi:excisionase family DNA binding protein